MQKFFKVACALKEMAGPSWETHRDGQRGGQGGGGRWERALPSYQLVVDDDQFDHHDADQVADAGVLVDGGDLNHTDMDSVLGGWGGAFRFRTVTLARCPRGEGSLSQDPDIGHLNLPGRCAPPPPPPQAPAAAALGGCVVDVTHLSLC